MTVKEVVKENANAIYPLKGAVEKMSMRTLVCSKNFHISIKLYLGEKKHALVDNSNEKICYL